MVMFVADSHSRQSRAAESCIWPSTYATSCFSSALSLLMHSSSALMASAPPCTRRPHSGCMRQLHSGFWQAHLAEQLLILASFIAESNVSPGVAS